VDRRGFLERTGLTFAAGALASLPAWAPGEAEAEVHADLRSWRGVRAQFRLRSDVVHLGTFLLASHPKPVRDAIARHRAGLDRNTVEYLHAKGPALEAAVLRAAASYLGASPADIALTDSTTMGLGTLYTGLAVRPGQEILTTEHDFFATHASLAEKARRSGATVRRVRLYQPGEEVTEQQLVDRLLAGVSERTRVVAITWVHSSTGVKLPIRRIGDALAPANAGRDAADRALLCVDGVHGVGVENVTAPGLGCDFLIAGTHKWLFGPRGTGLVWGRTTAWPEASPTIPSFSGSSTFGAIMTPGGFHSFEHRWALGAAFRFHERIGKARVEARIHALAGRFKEGLAAIPGVRVITPRSDAVSAGLICFEVAGLSPGAVGARLREKRIVATETPYNPSYARVGPGILNSRAEVDRALAAIRALA
jgi:selenocysteine lyase/cysteine desulfurase